ncbi:MAG: dephospho-CoA kinase [Clostridia bacterium]|nr:dephospho-CoA kinase [Clostridia bacterium]
MIIGLTGGSGTGKSTAVETIVNFGFIPIDFDRISRDVSAPGTKCLSEIVFVFGNDILTENKALNRRKLGEIVFADKSKLEILTGITHKYILEETNNIIASNKNENLLFDAPLLFEAGLEKKCDFVISILADRQKRIERICARDLISPESAKNRINSQPDDEFYISKSDYCVYNNSTQKDFKMQIAQIIRSKLNEASSK